MTAFGDQRKIEDITARSLALTRHNALAGLPVSSKTKNLICSGVPSSQNSGVVLVARARFLAAVQDGRRRPDIMFVNVDGAIPAHCAISLCVFMFSTLM
jgi:hypothetical protein